MPRALIVINPISGVGRRSGLGRARADLATGLLRAHGAEGAVRLTEGPGHAAALARQAIADGTTLVVAWGGDGTVNEVASVLAFTGVALGIVPSGSGNGLARELGVPFTPTDAIGVALTGRDRAIDAGEIDGRLFVNVAGLGLDAAVAHQFAERGTSRRGLARYVEITARELLAFVPDEYTVVADGARLQVRAFLVAIANTRQYGSRAFIAPHARPDDGRLDVVTVAYRSPWAALVHVPRLFTGTLDRVPGVTMQTAASIEVHAAGPVLYHVDGEPHAGGAVLRASVHPGALLVRVPRR